MTYLPSSIDVSHIDNDLHQKLEQHFQRAIHADVFPAASLAVIHSGKLVFSGAWGWIDPDTQEYPTHTGCYFDLASLTKLFSTTAFLRLVNEGRIRLDDSIADVIPEFSQERFRPIVGQQDPHSLVPIPAHRIWLNQSVDASTVRFRDLLTHSSGLPAWRALFFEVGVADPAKDEHKKRWQRILPFVYHFPFHCPPTTQIVYSDLGMIILGDAVSRIAQNSLSQAFYELIFEPSDLKRICFQPLTKEIELMEIAPTEDDVRWRRRRVWGEVHDENSAAMGGVAGHAGLFGTAVDVARFGESWRTNEINLSEELRLSATTEQRVSRGERRGLGWELKSIEDSSAGTRFSEASFGHTGFTGTSLWIDPIRELVVVLLTNRVYRGRHEAGIQEFRKRTHDILTQVVID